MDNYYEQDMEMAISEEVVASGETCGCSSDCGCHEGEYELPAACNNVFYQ